MGDPQPGEVPGTGEPERWVFTYGVHGDMRFISHHNTLQMFRRALGRAALPVRFTQGFNPHPKLSIPLPLPVGVTSDAESIVVEFGRPIDGDAVLRELRRHMPRGIKITSARHLKPGERSRPVLARYRLDLSDPPEPDIQSRVRQVSEFTSAPVERIDVKTGHRRRVDVRPHLANVCLSSGAVEFAIRITDSGTARPSEIAGLLGFETGSVNHRIRRLGVCWE